MHDYSIQDNFTLNWSASRVDDNSGKIPQVSKVWFLQYYSLISGFHKAVIFSGDNRFFLLHMILRQISVVLISGFHDSIGIVENHGIIKNVI